MFGVPQRAEFHPEIDTGLHTLMVCDMAARLAPGNARIGFAALTHDLGKALTPASGLPAHINHEHTGLAPLQAVCDRYKVPTDYRELAIIACREHLNIHRFDELRAGDRARPDRALRRLSAARAHPRAGRCSAKPTSAAAWVARSRPYPQAERLLQAQRAAQAITTAQLDLTNLSGPKIGEALRKARIAAIRAAAAKD